MQGQGQFIHCNGTLYKGTFANNLFLAKQNGKEYFLSPFDTKAQQQKNIELAVSAEAHRKKCEEKKLEEVSVYRAASYN